MTLAILLIAVALTACSTPAVAGSVCHYRGPLPDPDCTPGAVDPRVTQDNIHETICIPGYTSRGRWTDDRVLLFPGDDGYAQGRLVRPPTSYTNRLKIEQMLAYGVVSTPAEATATRQNFEEDHLISLELGGSPTDPLNLWPEPYAGEANARDKDRTENLCHAEVCAEHILLADAQREIAEDWRTACVT